MSIEILDKIKAIQGFDINTPRIVVIEIACCHGIEIKNINTISDDFLFFQKLKYEIICMKKEEINSQFYDWSKLARYINSKCLWNRKSLLESYDHFKFFSNMSIEEFIEKKNFNFKNSSPEEPTTICITLLYRFCKLANINLNFYSTFEEMKDKMMIFTHNDDYILSLFKSRIGRKLTKSQMLNFLYDNNLVGIENDNQEITFDKLLEYYQIVNDNNQLRLNLNPKVKSGAIALAAINYSWDISKSKDPILEYNYILTTDNRSFLDPDLARIHSQCEEYFDLRLTFNPIFPKNYYKCEQLAQYYGYSKIEVQTTDPYELLQVAHVSETFYKGISPKTIETFTSIDLIPFSELDINETFSYGILNDKIYVYSKQELINHFSFHRKFLSPVNYNVIINKHSIRKLKNMLKNGDELKNILLYIESLSEITDEVRDYICKYNNNCYNMLKNFLNLSMYMRGWKGGKSAFPLTLKKTLIPVERNLEVEINVNNAFETFYNSVQDCEIGELFINLPLYKYCDQQFYKNTNGEEGLTIGERLDIIKKGNKTSNMNSCIRISSNILAQTAYKYFLLVNLPPPFNIIKLKDIF